MSRQHHTTNPSYPHPEDDREPAPLAMVEAVILAAHILRDPTADQWARNKAADELIYSFETHEDDYK